MLEGMCVNLTTCSAGCLWQKDGLCTLPPDPPLGETVDGCCYFLPLQAEREEAGMES